ncbi:hypothetical protein C7447_102193 [Tenacibaculum adriaticum]|uniref:Tellurite resistance protein TerB n=1 Tax=Tenacibaculum adriaticum TaxID=413713 RepID=A0A5S5DSX5_9FLAO|nr:hypothetical protein [Tenacibaculum adriaticum]TYP98875.1 hypothetical protein C7447_102193 [Tenacibaculum adriaticum]
MTEKKFSKHFYIHIAYLFYSLAMVDKKIEIDEKRKIVAIVERSWLETIENKEVIYETLRSLIKEKITSEEAFQKFKAFVIANKEYFTNDTAKKIIKASHSICEAFASKNKSELILLARIHKLLQTNEA